MGVKAIVFDYIGVLVRSFDEFHTELSKISGKNETKIREYFKKHWQPLKVGKITDTEFWNRMRRDLKISSDDVKRAKRFVLNLLKVEKETLKNIRKLWKDYDLYLLSNSCYGWSEISFNNNGLRPYFRKIFFSHRLGLAKPDRKIYVHTLNEINLPPNEILFVDDSSKNIATAEKIGFEAIKFQNWSGLFKRLEKIK